jgi:hypothetical protein
MNIKVSQRNTTYRKLRRRSYESFPKSLLPAQIWNSTSVTKNNETPLQELIAILTPF